MNTETHFVGQITQKAILRYGDKFILVKERGSDKWILPGGRLNIDETLEEGLRREIKEELSVDCSIDKLLSAHAIHAKEGYKPKLFIFYYGTIESDQKIEIKNEIVDVTFISTKKELGQLLMSENQRKVLEEFLS